MTFLFDQNKSLGYLVNLAARFLSNTLATRFSEAGIDMTSEQWGVLVLVINEGKMTQVKIAERLFLERSSVSRLLDGLERRGWIERNKDPKDSRQKIVTPTEKVLETAQRCAEIATDALKDAQRGMTEDEKIVCRSFLSRIINNLK